MNRIKVMKISKIIVIFILSINLLHAQNLKSQLDSIQIKGEIMQFEQNDYFIQKAQISPDGKKIWTTIINFSDIHSLQQVARFEKVDSIWNLTFVSDEGIAFAGFKNNKAIYSSTQAGIGWNISGIRNSGWNKTRDYIQNEDEEVFYTSDKSGKFQLYMKHKNSILILEDYPENDVLNLFLSTDNSTIIFDLVDDGESEIRYANMWTDDISADQKLKNFDGCRSLSYNDKMFVIIKDGKLKGYEITKRSLEKYHHMLKRKIGNKIYEEYVNSNNYGYYNNIVILTDSIHSHIIKTPIEDLTNKQISIFHIIDIIGEDKDWYLAVSKSDTLTLIPDSIAIINGIKIGDNLIKKENITQEKYIFLANNYVSVKETLFNHDNDINDIVIADTKVDKFSTNNTKSEELSEKEKAKRFRNLVEFGKGYSQKDLINKLLNAGYKEGFLQLGLYPDNKTLSYIQGIMPKEYIIESSIRTKGASLLQFFVVKKTQEVFDALRVAKFRFKNNKRTKKDDPFIRFGDWTKGFKIVRMDKSGNFIVLSM